MNERIKAGGIQSTLAEADAKKKKIPIPEGPKLKLADTKNLTQDLVPSVAEEAKTDKKEQTKPKTDAKAPSKPDAKADPKRPATAAKPADKKVAEKPAEKIVEQPDASDPIEVALFHRRQAGNQDSVISEADAKKKKLVVIAPLKL
jgi:hypothetical protein